MSVSDKPRPFLLNEAGADNRGWVSMGSMGHAACRAIQATAVVVREAK